MNSPSPFATSGFTAYDYLNQRWVHGEDARLLLIIQVKDELALLQSERGASYYLYVRAKNCKLTLLQAIAGLQSTLAGLEGTVCV